MPSVSNKQAAFMRAVAHDVGFAKKVGVPQKVGRDYFQADKAAGKFKTKGDSMKSEKHHKKHSLSGHGHVHNEGGSEGIMGSSAGMSPRKAMASGMGAGSGNFGVKSYESEHGPKETHPDAKAMTGAKPVMEDHERGIGESIRHTKGHHPAQASPSHGPTHPGGHGTGHYGHEKH